MFQIIATIFKTLTQFQSEGYRSFLCMFTLLSVYFYVDILANRQKSIGNSFTGNLL